MNEESNFSDEFDQFYDGKSSETRNDDLSQADIKNNIENIENIKKYIEKKH